MKIEEFIDLYDCEDSVFIGNENTRSNYFSAIVGIDYLNHRLVYDKEKLKECFMVQDGMTEEEAYDWISYNVESSLPSTGPNAPILIDSIELEN